MGTRRGRSRGWIFPLLTMAVLVALPGGLAGAAPKTPPGDPPGNNGTIKIERDAPNPPENEDEKEANNNNEPHVDSCIFWVEFYGFDQGETADITFTHVKSKKELVADKTVPISDDAAGGGQDLDNVIGYNLTSAVQGLEAHKKHGYHIKVASNSTGAPGGAKHKVFWIKCNPAPTSTLRISKAVQGTGTGPFAFTVTCNHRPLDTTFMLDAGGKHDIANVPAGTTCVAVETDAKGAEPVNKTETPADDAADGKVKVAGSTPTTITFTNVFPGTGGTPPPDDSDIRNPQGGPAGTNLPAGGGETAGTTGGTGTDVSGTTAAKPDTSVLGESQTQPEAQAALPRTGSNPRALTATGLWALGAGGLALLGGRRRRRS